MTKAREFGVRVFQDIVTGPGNSETRAWLFLWLGPGQRETKQTPLGLKSCAMVERLACEAGLGSAIRGIKMVRTLRHR